MYMRRMPGGLKILDLGLPSIPRFVKILPDYPQDFRFYTPGCLPLLLRRYLQNEYTLSTGYTPDIGNFYYIFLTSFVDLVIS
jgi:hypothetical protein